MRYTLLIAFLLLLLNCKTTRKETALLDTHNYTQKELERKYIDAWAKLFGPYSRNFNEHT